MKSLSEAKAGERCEIKWMFGIPEILDFMRERGVDVGSTVSVIQNRAGSLIIGAGQTLYDRKEKKQAVKKRSTPV